MKAFVLEQGPLFTEFSRSEPERCRCRCQHDLSTKFLRYAEQLFSNGKHDTHHRPSINSCLLRVPGTYNSKNGERVKIIQQWDRYRPPIQDILTDFRITLIEEELVGLMQPKKYLAKKLEPMTRLTGLKNCFTLLSQIIGGIVYGVFWLPILPMLGAYQMTSLYLQLKAGLWNVASYGRLKEGPVIVLDTI